MDEGYLGHEKGKERKQPRLNKDGAGRRWGQHVLSLFLFNHSFFMLKNSMQV